MIVIVYDGRSQRLPYERELDGRLVADSELVVPGRDASCLLQKADPALDFVSALVHFAVESGWTAAEGTTPDPVSGLVPLLRDGVRNPAFTQVGADLAGGVRPVGKYMLRPGAGASTADPGARIRSITCSKIGASPRWPAVMTAARTWKEASTAR